MPEQKDESSGCGTIIFCFCLWLAFVLLLLAQNFFNDADIIEEGRVAAVAGIPPEACEYPRWPLQLKARSLWMLGWQKRFVEKKH